MVVIYAPLFPAFYPIIKEGALDFRQNTGILTYMSMNSYEKEELFMAEITNTLAAPSSEELVALSESFKVLGDPTRMRLLWALCEEDRCVNDLAEIIGMGQSAVSHQLRLLRQARLVRYRREGKTSIYSLDDDHIRQIFELGLSHVREEKRS